MKKRLMMIATLVMAIYNMVLAEEKVTISDFKISAGETKEVSIALSNDVTYVAFQFDLYLPEGITVESYSADRSRVPESTTLEMSKQPDGSYRFLSAAMGGEPMTGNSGSIVTLTVKASDGLSFGEKTGYFRKVKLSKADATGPTYAEMSFPITVIEPSVVTVTSVSRQYGDANPTFEYTVTGGALEGTPEISCEATATSPVGTYDIVANQGSVKNHNVTYIKGTLTIEKAPLTIKAGTYTRKQGEEDPEFTLTYEGFKNNETEAVLTKKPTVTTTATKESLPGTYDVSVSGAEAQNYEISYINGQLTVTAGTFILTYKVDGEVYKTYEVEYGATITPEPAPTKEGYTFSGWSEIPATMPAKDVTVTGTFTINKYKLVYMVDGVEYKSFDIEYGAKITPEPAPTKEGYTFSGWSSIPETMPAKDVTVTGTFTKGAYKLMYMVDGEVYKTVTYDYGDAITPEPAPTKEGYTFSGWSEIPTTMPAQDVTVTGTFTINKYKLTYMVDGSEYKSYDIEYGAYITPEPEPTKDGYTFSGWSEIPTTMPAHDVEVSGTFTQVEFVIDDVTYEISGEGTVTIMGCDQKGEVTIDATVVINGQTYHVTAIAENAFKDNQSITSVTISDGITTIGDNAFNGCIGLIVINIGKDVKTIGNKAFANVGTASATRTRNEESMLIVNCYTESIPYTASDAFENTPIEMGTLYVVDNLKDSFKSTSPWSQFGKIIGFEESTGISAIMNGSGNALIFDMQGNRLDNVRKGVNIIRTRDGKTKKMMVK